MYKKHNNPYHLIITYTLLVTGNYHWKLVKLWVEYTSRAIFIFQFTSMLPPPELILRQKLFIYWWFITKWKKICYNIVTKISQNIYCNEYPILNIYMYNISQINKNIQKSFHLLHYNLTGWQPTRYPESIQEIHHKTELLPKYFWTDFYY